MYLLFYRKNIIKKVELFKENRQEDFLLEEIMIDKKGKETYLIVIYNKNCGLGIIYIINYMDNMEKVKFKNININMVIGSKCINII